ncbi:MAG TPA: hypothetical protein VGA61_14040 [Anaerolineae bacterium]
MKDRFGLTTSSVILALLMATASVAGLLYSAIIYPTAELRRWMVANDAVNLVVGVPLLLGSLRLARRGRLLGLLSWPGALFYVMYVYLAYLLSVPFGAAFLPYLLIFSLSTYTLISLMASLDGEAVRQKLTGRVPARLFAAIFLGLGGLILAREVALIMIALGSHAAVDGQQLAQWIDDFTLACPALLIVGAALWQRRALGYLAGPGLFLQYGVLSIGLIPGMASASPPDAGGMIVALVMAVICLVPFAWFVRASANTVVPD